MRTALAFRVGLAGGRKCVHGRDVGLGKVASMMAAKKFLGGILVWGVFYF